MSLKEFKANVPYRVLRLMTGLFLYALGQVFCMQAAIGLAPWDALNSGLVRCLGGTFGRMNVCVAIVLVFVDLLLKEKLGIGTISNAILIGTFFDWIQSLRLIPQAGRFLPGVGMMLLGLLFISVGTFLYVGAGFGSGPRDSLMVALCRRFRKAPVGVIRGCIEAVVLCIGWLLGGSVGIGTVIAVLGISVILDRTFRLFHFDPAAVQQESLADTVRAIKQWYSHNKGK